MLRRNHVLGYRTNLATIMVSAILVGGRIFLMAGEWSDISQHAKIPSNSFQMSDLSYLIRFIGTVRTWLDKQTHHHVSMH